MFEIKNGSGLDTSLSALESTIYYIRNCAEYAEDVEKAIEKMVKIVRTVEDEFYAEVEGNG